MSTRSMAYDHPTYITRTSIQLGANTAGAAAISEKFVAFTNMTIFGLVATMATVGASTSSYTGWNGTATVTGIDATTLTLLRLTNTATAGAVPVLATSTYGTFLISNYNGTATATQTNTAGFTNVIPLYGTGSSGAIQTGSATSIGGFPLNQGDIVWALYGTDTAAVVALALDCAVTPLATVLN